MTTTARRIEKTGVSIEEATRNVSAYLQNLDRVTNSDRMGVCQPLDTLHLGRAYFEWLCDIVFKNMETCEHLILLTRLHQKTFYYLITNDSNRMEDAIELRNKFLEEVMEYEEEPEKTIDWPVTVLEFLVALSIRWDAFLYSEDNTEPRTDEWFKEMLTNLGLWKYTDDEYAKDVAIPAVSGILNDFLHRKYKKDGKGGIFPVKKSKKDQREVEIWYQMMQYLNENYYFEDVICG